MNALDWVTTVLGFLGPILVVVVSARMEQNRKADARVKELENEKRAKEDKELKDTIDEIKNEVKKINSRVNDLDHIMKDLQTFDQETQDDLRTLSRTHQLTSTYIHQLAQLVTVLAEGMRDQHLDGNVTQAINEYRNFEHTTLTNLMSTSPIEK